MPPLPDLQSLYPLIGGFSLLLFFGHKFGLGIGGNFDGVGGSWLAGFMVYGIASFAARMFANFALGLFHIHVPEHQLTGAWLVGAIIFCLLECGFGKALSWIPIIGGFFAEPHIIQSALMGALLGLLWRVWPYVSDAVLYQIQTAVHWPWL